MSKLDKIFMFSGVIIILGAIIGLSYYKVYNLHIDNSYVYLNKLLNEAAVNCYRDDICDTNITVSDLELTGYLTEKIVDPRSKMYIGEDFLVPIVDDKADVDIRDKK